MSVWGNFLNRIRRRFSRPAPESVQQQLEAKKAALAAPVSEVKADVPKPQSQYEGARIKVVIEKDKRINVEDLKQTLEAAYYGSSVEIVKAYEEKEAEPFRARGRDEIIKDIQTDPELLKKEGYAGFGVRVVLDIPDAALESRARFDNYVNDNYFHRAQQTSKQKKLTDRIWSHVGG